jgi:hypothetical protein
LDKRKFKKFQNSVYKLDRKINVKVNKNSKYNGKNLFENLNLTSDIANNLIIFDKCIKGNSHSIPFTIRKDYLGNIKYFPPVSKEWKNTIYTYNHNNMINLPLYDYNINNLINSYFNAFFYHKILRNKFFTRRAKRISMNKIFLSKAEVKHTNSKVILTIYTYNREKYSFLKKINFLKRFSYLKIFKYVLILKNKLMELFLKKNKYFPSFEVFLFTKIKIIKIFLKNYILLFRKYKFWYNLNKYKFEEKLLYILSSLILKYYNKKVEFNIINLKSIILNSDIFTRILTLKLKKRKAKIIRMMDFILNRAILPNVNKIWEKSLIPKSVDFYLLENKYLNINLNSILKRKENNNLDEFLNKSYYNVMFDIKKKLNVNSSKILEIIFNTIKYKNMAGVRLIVSGRLTKRYRADRALYKLKWKGGLRNIDSSYKGFSSINLRGFMKSNLEYSIFTSKRRVGAFAVKGWLSGKSFSTLTN